MNLFEQICNKHAWACSKNKDPQIYYHSLELFSQQSIFSPREDAHCFVLFVNWLTQTFITAPIEIHKQQEENHPLFTPEMKLPAECACACASRCGPSSGPCCSCKVRTHVVNDRWATASILVTLHVFPSCRTHVLSFMQPAHTLNHPHKHTQPAEETHFFLAH